jgi:5-oxoprolinase (ATP-hydrolysing)
MLKPRFPSAVVAGNVEISQGIVDALYGALGIMAASQGTMNNLTFGNHRYQYYETLGADLVLVQILTEQTQYKPI